MSTGVKLTTKAGEQLLAEYREWFAEQGWEDEGWSSEASAANLALDIARIENEARALYNGHEGGHDFGGERTDLRAHIEQLVDEWKDDRSLTRDEVVKRLRNVLAYTALATPDRADLQRKTVLERVAGAALALDRVATWSALNRPEVESLRAALRDYEALGTPDRADPERRAEGLREALTAALADVVAAYHAERNHPGRWNKCQRPRCQNARLATEGRGPFAALTPPPAGKAVLGTTTANELEEGK